MTTEKRERRMKSPDKRSIGVRKEQNITQQKKEDINK